MIKLQWECDRLRKENKKLRAVAESAKTLVELQKDGLNGTNAKACWTLINDIIDTKLKPCLNELEAK
jgi:hypothetical protein